MIAFEWFFSAKVFASLIGRSLNGMKFMLSDNREFLKKHLSRTLSEAGVLNDEAMDQILETGALQDVRAIPKEIKHRTSHRWI
jgi:hypothetical protein